MLAAIVSEPCTKAPRPVVVSVPFVTTSELVGLTVIMYSLELAVG